MLNTFVPVKLNFAADQSNDLIFQALSLPSSHLNEGTLVVWLLSRSFVQDLLTERIDASIGLNLVVSLC